MRVLGLSGDFRRPDEEVRSYVGHDAAAVLVEDGEVLAAVEEERVCRVKHASYFPVGAIHACLAEAGLAIEDVDRFAFPWRQDGLDAMVAHWRLTDPTSTRPGTAVGYLEAYLGEQLGIDATGRVRFCAHHLAHAVSAVLPSGLGDCLVAVFDGSGDDRSGAIYEVRDGQLEERRWFDRSQSLGELYTTLIGAIGFGRFEEYKVMGLAPSGRGVGPTVDLSQYVELLDGGDYRLRLDRFHPLAAGEGPPLRRKGEPLRDTDRAFAAGLQDLLVGIVRHVLDHHRDETGLGDLCLAGGVIHNCAMNGELARHGGFDHVFVQPAAHDAGAALGAALTVCGAEGSLVRARPLRTMALGRDIGGPDEVGTALARWGGAIEVARVEAPAEAAAAALVADEVIGWVQGRAEFGPRALGQRSILADPRPAANRDRVNQLVKRREGFRPFAPAVTHEALADWFVPLPAAVDTDFMSFVLEVRPDRREQLGAVTHVDGTARAQTVSRDVQPEFWALIDAFDRAGGVPVVLNTSFNGSAEPIVDTVDDAVVGLLTLGLDRLVIGPYVVTPADRPPAALLAELCPRLPAHRSLRLRPSPGGGAADHAVATQASPWFDQHEQPISAAAHDLLARAGGGRTIAALATDLDAELADELHELWRARVVILGPPD
jgi:carbamoyltransferase